MDAPNKSEELGKEPPSHSQTFDPTNCDFMKYLQPSLEAVNDQQQNADEYQQVYQTLSSGVYQTSDRQEKDQSQEQQKPEEKKQVEMSQSVRIDNEQLEDQSVEQPQAQIGTADRNEQQKIKYEQIDQQEQVHTQQVQNMLQSERKNQIQHKQQLQNSIYNHQQLQKSMNQYPQIEESMQVELKRQEKHEEKHEEDHSYVANEESIEIQRQHNSSVHIQIEESIALPQQNHSINTNIQRVQSNPATQYELLKEEPPNRTNLKNVEVILEKFSKNQSHSNNTVKISIVGYEQEYFLKIQTQIYNIDVHIEEKQYSIRRRFAEFATLSKLIRHHYPGYILYPFPQKNLESYKKLKLSMTTEQEKIILIEKRLLELEKYTNFLLSHQQISSSIILQIFLQESTETFQKQLNNLLSVSLQQEKELQLGVIEENYNSIKKIMKSGLNFFNSYLSSSQQGTDSQEKLKELQSLANKNNELFASFRAQLEESSQKLTNFASKIERLRQIYKSNSQISNIESNIDSVLKLSSKLSSSRSFYQKFLEWTEDNLIYNLKYYFLLLRAIGESLDYRAQLVTKINNVSVQYLAIGQKIEEKIELFDSRFTKDWKNVALQLQNNFDILYEKFNMQWKNHCLLMSKIWK